MKGDGVGDIGGGGDVLEGDGVGDVGGVGDVLEEVDMSGTGTGLG